MSDEKHTYKSEALTPTVLRFKSIERKRNRLPKQRLDDFEQRKSFFTPELIARLAERIKKL
jgi:hypothetical protein